MLRITRSQTQLASNSTPTPTSSPEAPRRPRKEKATEPNEIDTVQMNNHQAQLEEDVGVMNQKIGTIKELLKRFFIPQAPTTTRGDIIVEERHAQQQAAKTTTHGKAALGRRMNSQQVPQSWAESTHSAVPHSKKMDTKAGPSRPYNGAISGLPSRSVAPLRS